MCRCVAALFSCALIVVAILAAHCAVVKQVALAREFEQHVMHYDARLRALAQKLNEVDSRFETIQALIAEIGCEVKHGGSTFVGKIERIPYIQVVPQRDTIDWPFIIAIFQIVLTVLSIDFVLRAAGVVRYFH